MNNGLLLSLNKHLLHHSVESYDNSLVGIINKSMLNTHFLGGGGDSLFQT